MPEPPYPGRMREPYSDQLPSLYDRYWKRAEPAKSSRKQARHVPSSSPREPCQRPAVRADAERGAKHYGLAVSERGRIPARVAEQCHAAGGGR